jgi:hypothetical protein
VNTARKMNGADAYGKTVWSWHPWLMLRLAEIKPAQPGFGKSSIRGLRRQEEFVSGESTA